MRVAFLSATKLLTRNKINQSSKVQLLSRSRNFASSIYYNNNSQNQNLRQFSTNIKKMMKVITYEKPGDPDVLKIAERPIPDLKSNEHILVKVEATALNRADTLQRRGKYPPPPGESDIIGLEMSGVVEKIGEKVENVKVGDRVFGLLAGGGYAQYVTIHSKLALPIPQSFSFEEGAAIAETYLTAYQALYWLGNGNHENVLIHAGASGVGVAAIQLIKNLSKQKNKNLFVTVGSQDKAKFCTEIGATHAFNYNTEQNWDEQILKLTNGTGVNSLVDFVGANYFARNLNSLALDGSMVILAMMSGTKLENFDMALIQRKRLTITGSTLRNRDLDYKIRLTQDFRRDVLPLFEKSNGLKPMIWKTFEAKDVVEAHKAMEKNENTGKIVLSHVSKL